MTDIHHVINCQENGAESHTFIFQKQNSKLIEAYVNGSTLESLILYDLSLKKLSLQEQSEIRSLAEDFVSRFCLNLKKDTTEQGR